MAFERVRPAISAVARVETIAKELRARVSAQLAKLSEQADRLLDLIGEDDWPQEKIAARLRKIRDERARLVRQLDDTETPRLDAAEPCRTPMDLLADPLEQYRLASTRARRLLNHSFFIKI